MSLYKKTTSEFDKKLERIMEDRLEVEEYHATRGQTAVEVNFTKNGEQYHFELTLDDIDPSIGARTVYDLWGVLVYGLEDLARLVERNIWELSKVAEGFKALPAPPNPFKLDPPLGSGPVQRLKAAYKALGIAPGASTDWVKKAYQAQAKGVHPDSAGGGDIAEFKRLTKARDLILMHLTGSEQE